MFDDLKPYPAYGASHELLGPAPDGWNTTKLKHLVSVIGGATPTKERLGFWDGGTIPWVSPKDMKVPVLEDSIDHITEAALSGSSVRLVPAGSVLMVVRGMILARRVPIALTTAPVTLNQDMKALVPHPGVVSGAYLALLLNGLPTVLDSLVSEAGHGTKKLDSEAWEQLRVPVPPLDEQQAIVTYLAHAHQRIHKAIDAKQRLIALLDEETRALRDLAIHEATPSGPAPLLGRLLRRIEQGWSPTAAEGALAADQWAVLSLSAISGGRFMGSAMKPIPAHLPVPRALEINDGDVLMTRSNTRARVGDAAVVRNARPRTILSDLIYRLTPGSLLDGEYLALYLQSSAGRAQIESDARGSSDTMPKISQMHIKRWRVPVPPLDVQRAIVDDVQAEFARVVRARDVITREINLLKEFCTRLTFDVVTGQVDVRHIAASLPPIDPAEAFAGAPVAVGQDGETEIGEADVA